MAHDHDHVNSHGVADDFEYEDIDIKEALGLPDALPPIRLLPLPELAAEARQAPLIAAARRARRLGRQGRPGGGRGRRPDRRGPGRSRRRRSASAPRTSTSCGSTRSASSGCSSTPRTRTGCCRARRRTTGRPATTSRCSPPGRHPGRRARRDARALRPRAGVRRGRRGRRRRGRRRGVRLHRAGDGDRHPALPGPPGRADRRGVRRGAVGERGGRRHRRGRRGGPARSSPRRASAGKRSTATPPGCCSTSCARCSRSARPTTSSGSPRWPWPRCTSSWSRPGWRSRCCRRPPPS